MFYGFLTCTFSSWQQFSPNLRNHIASYVSFYHDRLDGFCRLAGTSHYYDAFSFRDHGGLLLGKLASRFRYGYLHDDEKRSCGLIPRRAGGIRHRDVSLQRYHALPIRRRTGDGRHRCGNLRRYHVLSFRRRTGGDCHRGVSLRPLHSQTVRRPNAMHQLPLDHLQHPLHFLQQLLHCLLVHTPSAAAVGTLWTMRVVANP